jgi:hypothetical protein
MSPAILSRHRWPLGFAVLLVAAVPALTGLGLSLLPGDVVPGVSRGWVAYWALIHTLILLLLERRWYANILTIAALVTVPVVFVGAALALVAVVPFSRLERRMLFQPEGITLRQKKFLMILRVFNHTAFFVIPSLLEVLREERAMTLPRADGAGRRYLTRYLFFQIKRLLRVITYLAVESICAAVQFIPLWAYEIGRLPESEKHRRSKTP